MIDDPKETIKRYLLIYEQVMKASSDRIEVLTETLQELLPGFTEECLKQSEAQAKRRSEQAKSLGDQPRLSAENLFPIIEKMLGGRTSTS